MASDEQHDLSVEHTEGFKVGEKKTIDEYHNLDAADESLQKWKASLLSSKGEALDDPNDPRKVILLSLGLEIEGRPDIIVDLTAPGAIESLASKPFIIKEGATFRMKVKFRVQKQILSGLKYVQSVKRGLIRQKMQEMIVSEKDKLDSDTDLSRDRMHQTPQSSLNMRRNVGQEQHILTRLTKLQSSQRQHPPACSREATTVLYRNLWMTTTKRISNSHGHSRLTRTGSRRNEL